MIEQTSDPYKAPEAELLQPAHNASILNVKRFSTWYVFGLIFITFGIYAYYWIYSRTMVINQNHDRPISSLLLTCLYVCAGLNFASAFIDTSQTELALVSLLLSLVNFILYIVVVFQIRDRLQDIMNRSSQTQYHLSGAMTFFFYVMYFQYKINECTDQINNARNSRLEPDATLSL